MVQNKPNNSSQYEQSQTDLQSEMNERSTEDPIVSINPNDQGSTRDLSQ